MESISTSPNRFDTGLHGEEIQDRFLADWSGLTIGRPAVVFRPTSVEEVSEILKSCHREGKRVTVQGGLTGVAGGGVPDEGDIVINLERMNRIEHIDELEGVMLVEAGATLQAVQEAATARDWMFAVDLGARGSCQIGGNASTNAGGIRVLKYGTMRDSVLGVEAVLADGTIVSSLKGLVKNSTGLDARNIFVGSEGTLGIITRLTLRLRPPMGTPSTAMVAADSFEQLPLLLRNLRRRIGDALCAFEFMSAEYVDMACSLTDTPRPLSGEPAWYVLVEAAGMPGESMDERLQDVLAAALDDGEITDCVQATNLTHAAKLWRIRESIPEVLTHIKRAVTMDIGLPWGQTSGFLRSIEGELRQHFPDTHHLWLGHLGDNNLHLLSGPLDEHEYEKLEPHVFRALRGKGGTISAEHGVGRLKKPFLPVCRSAEEIDMMRRIKDALDPQHILNPGRIFD
jgi:FAD/FMN-containing dehydrogenase